MGFLGFDLVWGSNEDLSWSVRRGGGLKFGEEFRKSSFGLELVVFSLAGDLYDIEIQLCVRTKSPRK